MKIFNTILVCLAICSCEKLVEPGPPKTQLPSEFLFSNDATATAAMLANYASLESSLILGNMVVLTGLSSDELKLNSISPLYLDVYNNNIIASGNLTDIFWNAYYKIIYQCNSILEGVDKSTSISIDVKKQLKGESLFLRGYCHFMLSNLYGPIPIVTTTDFRANSVVKRDDVKTVLANVINDMLQAKDLLTDDYKSAINTVTTERVRANKSVALAFLSKVYLYDQQWQNAEDAATEVINNTDKYALLSNLNDVFLKNSKEQIWQIQPTFSGFNTYTGYMMILSGVPYLTYLDKSNVDVFGGGDARSAAWVGLIKSGADSFFYSYKYKVSLSSAPVTEYSSLMRLAEVFLIRAEARAQKSDFVKSIDDLNTVRKRSGLPEISYASQNSLLDSIAIERRRELFTEGGNRWMDLKRTGEIDLVMPKIKGANWSKEDALYPIPVTEILRNKYLTQNLGY